MFFGNWLLAAGARTFTPHDALSVNVGHGGKTNPFILVLPPRGCQMVRYFITKNGSSSFA
ncbi:ORF35 [White spot syndrome virus]|uniref:ORF35 n=1 Tax=White spot syndrome virus TaxID=342409 RepID=A0A2D3I770_9VIRU|nr:ORF35 [White spot syndrome virus]